MHLHDAIDNFMCILSRVAIWPTCMGAYGCTCTHVSALLQQQSEAVAVTSGGYLQVQVCSALHEIIDLKHTHALVALA